jgi:hypothetical protein
MSKGSIGQQKLKAFRRDRGLTMEAAGALIVVDGKPVDRATWHGWESKGKIPKPDWMLQLESVVGCEPNDFYPRPDGDAAVTAPAQQALAL